MKIIEVANLKTWFPIRNGLFSRVTGHVKAVDGVTFSIRKGETMGLVGESGCGKTTVGRTILRLVPNTAGEVLFDGRDVYALTPKELRDIRPRMQIIFQDPYSSLSPRMPVGEIIGEAVREHEIVPKEEFDDYITSVMQNCGLQAYHKDRYLMSSRAVSGSVSASPALLPLIPTLLFATSRFPLSTFRFRRR